MNSSASRLIRIVSLSMGLLVALAPIAGGAMAVELAAEGPTMDDVALRAQDDEKKKKKKQEKKPRPAKGASTNRAESRFAIGEFAEADQIAALVLEAIPDDFRAARLRGEVALLENRLDDARSWLERALDLRVTHRESRALLAEVYRRKGDFPEAAKQLTLLGREAEAAQLASILDRRPYDRNVESVVLPFEQTDPLPIVLVGVNGAEPRPFLVDTGTAEIVVDSNWAAELGIERLGMTKGPIAGSRTGDVGHGVALSLELGELGLSDVPVSLADTSELPSTSRGGAVSGVLGMRLLYRFLATIDYPAGELRLAPRRPPRTPEEQEPGKPKPAELEEGVFRVPFRLGADLHLVARGRANRSEELLFLVDSGVEGIAFTCPESTIEEARIEIVQQAVGAGKASVAPFLLRRLSLGKAERENIPGVFGKFPEGLAYTTGFRIGGLVSHGFLRPYRVTFDFDTMEIVLEEP